MNSINTLQLCFFFQLRSQAFSNAVYATNSRYDPHFVTDTYLTVLAAIALEGTVIGGNI